MSDTPDRLAEAIRRVLNDEMERSPAVRDLLVELAQLVLAEADARTTTAERDRADETPPAGEGEPIAEAAEPAETAHDEHVTASVPLMLGDTATDVSVTGSQSDIEELQHAAADGPADGGPQQEAPGPKPIDLALIEERARLKAESCRFFIERRRDRGDPDLEPALKARTDEMIATAKSLSDCFLWVFWPYAEQPTDGRLLEIATCYDALADGAALCARTLAPDARLAAGEMQQAFQLLAEASSALRIALGATWLTADDTDQEEAHHWLRHETFNRGVFVERHMKKDDPASPERAGKVIAEAGRLLEAEEARAKKRRKVDQLFNKAAYHANRARNDPQPDRHDLDTINGVMEELRSSGIGPTDARVAEFREGLEGVEFPPDLPRHEHLSFRSRSAHQPDDAGDQWNERVAQARPLLEGGRIVIIGGEPNQDAIKRTQDAFGATVEWVELTEHGSGARMQAPIERPDTRVVLVLIKLTGHLHADEARGYARAAGVPSVNIAAGYNPNMVAEQVMAQAGERLSATAK